jgi:hypothetical protein
MVVPRSASVAPSFVGAFERRPGSLRIVVALHSQPGITDDVFAPYDVIGEVGARPIPVHVGRQSMVGGGAAQLVVAERFPGANRSGDAAGADLRREARRISTLANPHVARVREVALRGSDLVVFGDFIDGEKLREFWSFEGKASERLPLEIALRVLLDVLTGIGALHALRDSSQQPMKLTHGELSPSTILFGSDGVARILHTVARRAPDARAEKASLPYLAPEVHSGDAFDSRADIFSVGVLLWELLEGASLTKEGDEPAGIRVRSAPLPAPSAAAQKAPWAKGLVPVVTRALAAAPEDRWPTAAGLAAEIRKAAGLKLAAASAAAAFAKQRFGERVKQRRARWEAAAGPTSSSAAVTAIGPISNPPSGVSLFGGPQPQPSPRPLAEPSSRSLGVPSVRGEEFSSSVLESLKPPPPPPAELPSQEHAQLHSEQARSPVEEPPGFGLHEPNTSEVDVLPSLPPLREPDIAPASALMDAGASGEVPHGAPVVFDEDSAGPLASPFGNPSPLPAVATDAPPPPVPNRRRTFVLGGVAAAGIAMASILGVRAAHHEPPAAPEQAAASPASAQGPAQTPASAPAAPPASSQAPEPASTLAKPAPTHARPIAKPKPAAAPHAKPSPAHPQGHTK